MERVVGSRVCAETRRGGGEDRERRRAVCVDVCSLAGAVLSGDSAIWREFGGANAGVDEQRCGE